MNFKSIFYNIWVVTETFPDENLIQKTSSKRVEAATK